MLPLGYAVAYKTSGPPGDEPAARVARELSAHLASDEVRTICELFCLQLGLTMAHHACFTHTHTHTHTLSLIVRIGPTTCRVPSSTSRCSLHGARG